MIGTLAVGYIIYSIVLVYSKSFRKIVLPEKPPLIRAMATDKMTHPAKGHIHVCFAVSFRDGFSLITVLCVILLVIMAVVMYKTKFGKRLHAVGQGHHIAELDTATIIAAKILFFISFSFLLLLKHSTHHILNQALLDLESAATKIKMITTPSTSFCQPAATPIMLIIDETVGQGHHIAELAGIPVKKMLMLVFIFSALIAGVASDKNPLKSGKIHLHRLPAKLQSLLRLMH